MSTYARWTPRWTRWAVGTAGGIGLLLAVGACGGGSPGAAAQPQPQTAVQPAQPAPAAPAGEPQPAAAVPQPAQVQPAQVPAAAAPAALKPQFGGVLQYPVNTLPSCLYVFNNGCEFTGTRLTILPLFEGLLDTEYVKPGVETRGVGKYAPALAESWKRVDDRTWEFTLRQGAKFHDGVELTSKDVVWSLQRWADSTSVGALRSVAAQFEKVEATGPYGVRITLKESSPYLLESLTDNYSRILPAHPAERVGNPTGEAVTPIYDKNPIGTGPFKLRSFDKGTKVELERYEGYWKHRPYLDGIRALYIRDRATWLAAFATRKVDFVTADDRVQSDQLRRSVPDAAVATYPVSVTGLVFNQKRKPFDDVRVRRALDLAIDRQALVQTVTFGEGFIAVAPMLPTMTLAGWGIQPAEYLQWPGYRQPKAADITEAKHLLAEAGVPPGFKFVIKSLGAGPQYVAFAGPLAGQLRTALGLDVTAQPIEPATFISQVQVGRDFDVAFFNVATGTAPAVGMYQQWHSKGRGSYYADVNDPDLDRIIEAALKELDNSKRNELYRQVQLRIRDNAYTVASPVLRQYLVWQPWAHELYASLSALAQLVNTDATWLEVGALPADRRSW